MTTESRLSMPLGETIYSLRAIRRFKPDPIPDSDLRDIMEAAIRAPNGGNAQPWHFLVIRDTEIKDELGTLYYEAWWAKRKDEGIDGPEDIPPGKSPRRSAMRLANEFGKAPVIVLVCATAKGQGAMGSVIPSVQNLLLAARALVLGVTGPSQLRVQDVSEGIPQQVPGENHDSYGHPGEDGHPPGYPYPGGGPGQHTAPGWLSGGRA